MTTRTRSRKIGEFTGTWDYKDAHQEKNSSWYTESCTDVDDDPGRDHSFSLSTIENHVCVANGIAGGGRFVDWPIKEYTVSKHSGSAPELDTYVTEHLAKANPATSSVDLPTFIVEAGDIPRLLRDSVSLVRDQGTSILKKIAKGNLSLQFGWKPMIGDLKKLYDFQHYVDRRILEIESLYSSGGLRRRTHFGEDVHVGTLSSEKTLHSSLSLWVRAKYQDTTLRETWATSRWVPNPSWANRLFSDTDGSLQRREVIKFVLGLNWSQYSSSVWESLPWSWLVDWFADVGDYIQATNNSIAHVSGKVCVMRTSTTTREYSSVTKPSGITLSELSSEYVTKTRKVFDPVPKVCSRTFLSGRRLSILGSLAALKGRFL